MTMSEIFGISAAFLTSLGGGGIIIFGCSSWLGKVWANRILESEKLTLQKEIEVHKTGLQKEIEGEKTKLQQEVERIKVQYQLESEKHKAKYLRYSESQFKLYNDLWSALCELEVAAEELWETANTRLVLELRSKLSGAKIALRKGCILIEEHDYRQLLAVLNKFEEFQFGKGRLVSLRSRVQLNDNYIDEAAVRNAIEENSGVREE